MNSLAPIRTSRELGLEQLKARNLELTRTLQMVEEARAILADQYDFAPLGFVTLDAKGCIREINLTAAKMLGRERSQLLGSPFLTHVEKSHCKSYLNHLRDCRNQHSRVRSEVALRTFNNQALQVELRSVPVIDPHRGGTLYRTVITDISERLLAGKALRDSEERYRDLVELSPDGILIETDGIIGFANRAAQSIWGVKDANDLIGAELMNFVRPAFRRAVAALLAAQRPADVEAPAIETQLTRADGTAMDVELIARGFRYEGEAAVLVIVRDISRRRQAERHVLTISERERSGFGRDLHDSLCQSLMGAAFMADTLRKKVGESGPEVAALADQIARVVRLCGDEARSLARGLCPVNMEKSGLVAALHELVTDIRGRARVECALECDDTLTISDLSVATNLYRIAQEAVANAIKHGKAKSIVIRLAAANGRMALCIKDDGRGIHRKPKKTGMGLHTMHYRATMLGGSLEVRRDHPRGTVVTCSFPTNSETP